MSDSVEQRQPQPLHGIRVLDASDIWGSMAGRVLAELGAQVIRLEPPEGAAARSRWPIVDGRSMYWASVAAGQRSLVGADPAPLLADIDVFIEGGFTPGLTDRFPALVHVSVTPFGVDGPMADAPATELTVEAAGGLVGLQGDRDRPPVPMGSMPQAAFHAGVQAAADALIALFEREHSGRGQHLDVSAQCCVVWTLMNATGFPPNTGGNAPGTGESRGGEPPRAHSLRLPGIVKCVDGFAQVQVQGAVIGERTFDAMLRWAERETEAVPQGIRGLDLKRWLSQLRSGELAVEDAQAAADAVTELVQKKTKAQLQAFSAEHGLTVAAIHTIPDLLADPHLAAREYWLDFGGVKFVGPFAKLSRTPLSLDRTVPELGEMKRVEAQLQRPSRRGSSPVTATPVAPFAGLKIADFSWVGVGPMIAKAFADQGADVVRIESSQRLDLLRTLPPFKDREPGVDRSQFMANFNTSKRGMTINLKHPDGQRVARQMAGWADVVLESFSPGTLQRFGLDWSTISASRDDLVMLSTCMRGQTGPERTYSGFGGQGAALAGLFNLVGWPDRNPTGPWGAYTDFITPRFGIAALTAALIHRDRTGEGQYIDLSQIEAGIRFVEPLVLEHAATGVFHDRMGMDSPGVFPHGVFAVRGDERYVAVAVENADQWLGLSRCVELPCGFEQRWDDREATTSAIARWLGDRDGFEAVEELRRQGVPAAVVARPTDLYVDPQLLHRGFFVTLDHAVMGPTPYDGAPTLFSRTPAQLSRPAPLLGEHTQEVLADCLAFSDDEIAQLRADGALD